MKDVVRNIYIPYKYLCFKRAARCGGGSLADSPLSCKSNVGLFAFFQSQNVTTTAQEKLKSRTKEIFFDVICTLGLESIT